jgi:hypothetical protein
MQLKGNFDEFANVGPDGIAVSGTTSLFADHEVIVRRVTIQQGRTIAEGPATLDPDWKTDPPLPAEGFDTTNTLLAIGFELLRETGGTSPIPSYVTHTWADVVKFPTPPK